MRIALPVFTALVSVSPLLSPSARAGDSALCAYGHTHFEDALAKAVADPVVGVKIAPLTGDDSLRQYVTQVPPGGKLAAHYHRIGFEMYQIVEGEGRLHLGQPHEDGTVDWEPVQTVQAGEFFTIPEGTVHQLRNGSDARLVLVFTCPAAHLGADRYVVQEQL